MKLLRSHSVDLLVTNRSNRATELVLEPWGEIHSLARGATTVVSYLGDPKPKLSIDVSDDQIKVWAEGPGRFVIR
jgi:hypothetical protein